MSEGYYSSLDAEVNECDSVVTENVIHFNINNPQEPNNEIEEYHEASTPLLIVDAEFAIKPGTLQVQLDEGDAQNDYELNYDYSEENDYAILTTEDNEEIEAEYIDFDNPELEEGEIRDENLFRALRTGYSHVSQPHDCTVCHRSFSQKGNLLRHYQTHTGDRPFACKLCGHRFTQKSNLQKHIATHNGDKNYECGACHKSFVQKANLVRHLRIHTGEKPFECKLCGHKFTQKGNLNKHMQLHSSDTVSTCDYCGCKFSSYTARMRHETRFHKDKLPEYADDEDPDDNQCDECPASFRTKRALRKHKKYHK